MKKFRREEGVEGRSKKSRREEKKKIQNERVISRKWKNQTIYMYCICAYMLTYKPINGSCVINASTLHAYTHNRAWHTLF